MNYTNASFQGKIGYKLISRLHTCTQAALPFYFKSKNRHILKIRHTKLYLTSKENPSMFSPSPEVSHRKNDGKEGLTWPEMQTL